ncbi:hypothetical protein F5884DRAFT_761451 [Xylogone sp. PMI_703]|nr:hypothetical protein F5884DRAFT_761451 [Xylogone sp. PMI_703]
MAWGHSTSKPPPPPRSALSKLLPLFFLFAVVFFFAFIGYHLYLSVQKISSTASQKMDAKHISLHRDGMKVGVKELKNERYVDKTQNVLVKAWNLGSVSHEEVHAEARKPYSRTPSHS